MLKRKIALAPIFDRKQAIKFAVILSFILNTVLILGVLHGQSRGATLKLELGWKFFLRYFIGHFLCNVAFFYLLFIFNFKIIRSNKKEIKMPFLAGLATLLTCLILSPIMAQIQWSVFLSRKGVVPEGFMLFNLLKDMILGGVIILVTYNLYNNYKREQIIIANQRLTEENIRIRFEALKNQLDPHFLFNSLNTLNGLIGIDDERAHEYVDHLSSVFRYTLENKNIRTLDEEIAFVDSYVTLLKIRYGDNLVVQYNFDEQYNNYLIMPVSLQLLVENAVKHNVISNKSRLFIHIETTDKESVIVSNRVNPKTEEKLSAGVGLANLIDRYAILFKKNIIITNLSGVFAVEVPLIKETEKALRHESHYHRR